jgi:hypothetical protein
LGDDELSCGADFHPAGSGKLFFRRVIPSQCL